MLRCLAGLTALTFVLACGARSSLQAPDGAGGAGAGSLVCPGLTTCGDAPAACLECVNAGLASCGGISDCDAGQGGCAGDPLHSHACRVWAVETVSCLVDCPFATCQSAYFNGTRGPILPVGLVFNGFHCAVCNACADACSTTPNFEVICHPD